MYNMNNVMVLYGWVDEVSRIYWVYLGSVFIGKYKTMIYWVFQTEN